MLTVKWTLVGVVVGYTALLALMYVAQRSLMYFPERVHTPPAMAGLPEAQEIALDTEEGERVIVWHLLPSGSCYGASPSAPASRLRSVPVTGLAASCWKDLLPRLPMWGRARIGFC